MKLLKRCCFIIVLVLCVYWTYSRYSNQSRLSHVEQYVPDDDPNWNPFGTYHTLDHDRKVEPYLPPGDVEKSEHVVEVWGKSSVGLYLWEHVMNSSLESKLGGIWSYGSKTIGNIKFIFRTGPGVAPEHVPQDTRNLVLVLNGMRPEKIVYAKAWLDSLVNFTQLKNVAVLVLGDEGCHNEWLHPYLVTNGGLVSLVFVVYDSPEVDNKMFYQWPLGVATYRQFPRLNDIDESVIESPRPYLCNYLATVYPGSTRESLLGILNNLPLSSECIVKPRMEWLPAETDMSRQQYVDALKDSDLTLHAAGKNAECYRLYEALSYGSLPIVEEAIGITKGQCVAGETFRQLKEYNAPVIFIKDWNGVDKILEDEKQMTKEEKYERRKQIVRWYKDFLNKLRDKFVGIIQQKFFPSR